MLLLLDMYARIFFQILGIKLTLNRFCCLLSVVQMDLFTKHVTDDNFERGCKIMSLFFLVL